MFEFPSGQTVLTDKVEHGTKSNGQTMIGEEQHQRMSAEFMQPASGLRGSIPSSGSMALGSSDPFPALGKRWHCLIWRIRPPQHDGEHRGCDARRSVEPSVEQGSHSRPTNPAQQTVCYKLTIRVHSPHEQLPRSRKPCTFTPNDTPGQAKTKILRSGPPGEEGRACHHEWP